MVVEGRVDGLWFSVGSWEGVRMKRGRYGNTSLKENIPY